MHLSPRTFGRTDGRAPQTRGVSLFVVVASLVVIAIFASLAIPKYFEQPEITLENACKLLERDLRSAQNSAAYRDETVRVVFKESGYEVLDSTGSPAQSIQGDRILGRSYLVEGIFNGVSIHGADFAGEPVAEFGQDGLCVEGGHLIVRFRDYQRRVVVELGTGRVNSSVVP